MSEMTIAQVPLFASLPLDELRHLQDTLTVRTIPEKTVLFEEGDIGEYFYVILEGQLEIIKAQGTPEEHIIAVRGPGEFIGEISLLERDGLRTAGVVARSQARLLEMTRADFDSLLNRNPMMAYEMVHVLGTRLKASHDAAIRDLQEKNQSLAEAYEELRANQEQLIEKEKLEHELQVAYEIQVSILPQELPEVPGYGFSVLMVPARRVGGDFYDFIQLERGLLGIAIGDVADKGVPSAIFMAQTKALLRAEAESSRSPSHVLEQVNRLLQDMNHAGIFVTVVYGLLEPVSGIFRYARAGHELPLVLSRNGEVRFAEKGQGIALGVTDTLMVDEQQVLLAPGDSLLLYTDGVTDTRGPQGEYFGAERLKAAAREAYSKSAEKLRQRILQSVSLHQGSAPQDDDITMVVVQRSV